MLQRIHHNQKSKQIFLQQMKVEHTLKESIFLNNYLQQKNELVFSILLLINLKFKYPRYMFYKHF